MSQYDPFRPPDPPRIQVTDGSGDDRTDGRSTWRADSGSNSANQPARDALGSVDRTPAQPSGDEPDGQFREQRTDSPRSIPVGDVFELLADDRRRRLLSVLRSVEGWVPVSRLVDELDGRETATRRSIQISLLHDHLPRLAAMDLIAFDRSRRRVRPTADFRAIDAHLETILEAGESVAERDD